MKTPIFCLALVLGGCVSHTDDAEVRVSPEVEARLAPAAQRFEASIKNDKTWSAVVARLGAPQKGSAVWEVRFDERNFESLTAEFGPASRIASLTREHARAKKENGGTDRSVTGWFGTTTITTLVHSADAASVPAGDEARMAEAAAKFEAITRRTTTDQVFAQLGAPNKATAIWEVRHDRENFESLSVEFGTDGQLAHSEGNSGRASHSLLGLSHHGEQTHAGH